MANTLLDISMIAKESLLSLKNELGMAKSCSSQYDDRFAKSGAKIGDTISIRKANRYAVNSGQTLSLGDVEEESVSLTLDSQRHVDFQFSSKDMALTIDEFSNRYIKPAIIPLANSLDVALAGLYTEVPAAVGTPGTTMTDLTDALAAHQKMKEAGCPVTTNNLVIDPAAEASVVNGLSGKFQSAEQISRQYEKGMMGLAGGFAWKMDQNVAKHTVGAYAGTPLVDGASQVGSTLNTDGWTSGASALAKGDVFTIANVFAVNPQSKISTGQLQQFVVTAAISDTSGDKAISIYPAITVSGAKQNVSGSPADNAAITVKGTASTAYPQHLAFHKDAFVFGCADLVMPSGVDMASRASDADSGLALRIVRDYDINNDRLITRIDVLFGVLAQFPELGCRIYN
ncbi:MAG: P22 phage major capsid protein family protein [Pseudoalteromonas sp.]